MPSALLSPLAGLLQALLLAATLVLAGPTALAKDAPPTAEDPVLEKRLTAIAVELRCLVCQNQTIADSNADLAVDLRNQVRDMLRQGKSEREIIDYMTARYGDFVLYRPPVKNTTALLWFGPAVLLVAGVGGLWLVLRRRSRLGAEAFDPEDATDPDAAAADGGAPGSAAASASPSRPAR
jgi:cytochrome c-type biogenesis protein CcmH